MNYLSRVTHSGSGNFNVFLGGMENKAFRLEFNNMERSSEPTSETNWLFHINDITTEAQYINNVPGTGSPARPNSSLKDNDDTGNGRFINFNLLIYQKNNWVITAVQQGQLQNVRRSHAIDLGSGNNLLKLSVVFSAGEQIWNQAYVDIFEEII